LAYRIQFKKSVARDLKKIGKTQAKSLLQKIEDELSNSPENHPALTGKFAGLRRLRIGDYRVIFSILGDTVLILWISHRKDAYR
jgi:addiction module RelE/StbE family toxin